MEVQDGTKDEKKIKAPLLAVELAWRVFASEQFAGPAFPAGNNNLTVVCCHGISTKTLFLLSVLPTKWNAYETLDLTLCSVYLYILLWLCLAKKILLLLKETYTFTCSIWSTIGTLLCVEILPNANFSVKRGTLEN